MGMLELVRFRPLANEEDLCRAIRMITTGEFWCSKLWDMNDPMEGVYLTLLDEKKIEKKFEEKNGFVICSFSSEEALENPLSWGYYANGFKGIAIGIEVNEQKILKRNENENIPQLRESEEAMCDVHYLSWKKFKDGIGDDVGNIITRKLSSWEMEKEYRFLKKSNDGWYKISTVQRVYVGNPYGNVVNLKENIIPNSKTNKRYLEYRSVIEDLCDRLDIDVYYTKIEGDNKVNCSLSPRSEAKKVNGTGPNRV